MEKNLYLCLYQFKGMETEGHLSSKEKFICVAEDKTEALHKYSWWLCLRNSFSEATPYYKTLSEYRKDEFAAGGWGAFAYKLDKSEIVNRNDLEWFNDKYKQYSI